LNGRVPGCSGTAQGKTDYCVVPTDEMLQYVGNNNRPKTAFPLEKCQGDCDNMIAPVSSSVISEVTMSSSQDVSGRERIERIIVMMPELQYVHLRERLV